MCEPIYVLAWVASNFMWLVMVALVIVIGLALVSIWKGDRKAIRDHARWLVECNHRDPHPTGRDNIPQYEQRVRRDQHGNLVLSRVVVGYRHFQDGVEITASDLKTKE